MRPRKSRSLEGLHRVYWHRNQWQYKSTAAEMEQGQKAWVPLGTEDWEARAAYAEMKNSLDATSSMSMLLDRWLATVVSQKAAERTRRDDHDMVERLRKVFGRMNPRAITPAHVQRYMEIRGEQSKNQANKELSVLNQVFRKGLVWGYLETNPTLGVTRYRIQPRKRLPKLWEIEALKKHANPRLKIYIDIKLMTGLRQGDMLSIKTSDLTDDGIAVTAGKTGTMAIIEWSEPLRKRVNDIIKLNKVQGQTLFCTRSGKPVSRHSFKEWWQAAMRKALDSGDIQERFTEHDIRATHLYYAEQQGLDGTTQLLHSDPNTTKIYRRSREVLKVTALHLHKG